MAGEDGVVLLDVELDVASSRSAEESRSRCDVEIVLVLVGSVGLGSIRIGP